MPLGGNLLLLKKKAKIIVFIRIYLTKIGGGAPCIKNGLLSLAICKPAIRRTAKKGDWVTMFASTKIAGKGVRDRLYCMFEVSDVITMQEYGENHTNRMDCIYDQNLEHKKKK